MLSSLLERAGGLTDLAFPEGSVFTRVELQTREREELETLAREGRARPRGGIGVGPEREQHDFHRAIAGRASCATAVATGRLVIRLDDVVHGMKDADVLLKDGDQLIVPDRRQEVTVLGEVQYATSHLYEPGLTRDDYIERSGGLGQKADRKHIYVVRANGAVVADTGGRWFSRGGGDGEIQPGDAIVVPLHLDQSLSRWASITQIIYNLAIAAAAVHSF